MRTFEIHITGSFNINDVLDSMGIKNIIVDLLTPEGDILRSEHMSSFVEKHETYGDCLIRVQNLVNHLKQNGVEIYRVKIESPYYDDYVPMSKYIESHFIKKDNQYAMSVNRKSGKIIGTDRTYNKIQYDSFKELWKDEDVELCLYDNNFEQDKDWLEMYGGKW